MDKVKDLDVGKSEKTDKDQKMETVEEKDKTVHTDNNRQPKEKTQKSKTWM